MICERTEKRPISAGGLSIHRWSEEKHYIQYYKHILYIFGYTHIPPTFVIQLTSQQLPIWYCSSHWSPINFLGKKTSNLHPSLHPCIQVIHPYLQQVKADIPSTCSFTGRDGWIEGHHTGSTLVCTTRRFAQRRVKPSEKGKRKTPTSHKV